MRTALCLILVVALISAVALGRNDLTDCQAGCEAGQQEGRNSVSFASSILGFFTVGIHTLIVALPPGREAPLSTMQLLESESAAYINGFTDGYRNGSQRRRVLYSGLGALAAYLAVGFASLVSD